MNHTAPFVSDNENVARILSREWFNGEKLLHMAFALRIGETYVSVNRPSVDSFHDDVVGFVKGHLGYVFGDNNTHYRIASMNVGKVRKIDVCLNGVSADIDVTVEPRASKIKSHAGIFVCCQNRNLKMGDAIRHLDKVVPVDDILLKVRLKLTRLASVEQYEL